MRKFSILLTGLFLLVSLSGIQAQSFSVSSDSTHCLRPYTTSLGDTTGTIRLINLNSTPLDLKIILTFEDLSPDFALCEFNYGFLHSHPTFSVFNDSLTITGNDSVDFRGVFISSPAAPSNKFKITVYESGDSINSYQILTFAAIKCGNPDQNIIVNPSGSFCSTDSVNYSINSGFYNYQWSTGETTPTIRVQADSLVTIVAEDSIGCPSYDTSNIDVTIPFEEQICIVSVDSLTGKNIVVWEKTPLERTEKYYIYKETFVAGVYNLIGFVNYDSLSVFIDVNSNPLQQAERYKISAIDSCGIESLKSSDHKTIHLTASVGTSNENNLVWDGYEGFTFPTYNIYRGSTPNNMTLLAQVASSAFTYSDLTPLVGNNFYKVEAVRSSTCTPTQKTTTYPSSISNQVVLNPLSVNEFSNTSINIYPVPTKGLLTVSLGRTYNNIDFTVKNVLGSTIKSGNNINTNSFDLLLDVESGIYFLEITVDSGVTITKRIIRN